MKKIISILVVAMLLVTTLLATVPASAADTKELVLDWTKFDYVAYNDSGIEISEDTFMENFEITKTSDTFGASRLLYGINSNSYISTSQFAITATTSYTYEVMAKNNNTTKYSGVPYAIDADYNVYFVYGSFDNNNDSTNGSGEIAYPGKSYVIGAKGDFDNKYPNSSGDEMDSMYFAKLQQTDGFASFKFVYEGLTVKVYAKDTSGTYIQMGDDIALPEGSKVAFGLFSRDGSNNGNRTTTVKNGKITANNAESVANMSVTETNGASDLKAEISRIEKEYLEVDYTADTYAALKEAIENAKAVANDAASSAAEVTDAATTLQTALDGLTLGEVDTTKLEETIAKAEALKEVEYTSITYGMVTKAVANAKTLMESTDAKQSQIDAAVADIEGKIDALVPSGVIAEPDEDGGDAEGTATDAPAGDAGTQAPAGDAGTPAPAPASGGCGSAVATTAVVVGLVATLGTALVIKKRD